MPSPRRFDAVLFDFGGVVATSPLTHFRAFEVQAGLPPGFLSTLLTSRPDENAWACFERGELTLAGFIERFEAEAEALGARLDTRHLLSLLQVEVRPEMVAAIEGLSSRGYKVSCLTNNMAVGHGRAMAPTPVAAEALEAAMERFDHVIESRAVGSRKPEARFFQHACRVVGVDPSRAVFLDDLGVNLKGARAMGMTTIKVVDAREALAELETVLGHPLTARRTA